MPGMHYGMSYTIVTTTPDIKERLICDIALEDASDRCLVMVIEFARVGTRTRSVKSKLELPR